MVKKAGDRALTLAAVASMTAIGGAMLIALSDSPAQASWPWIAASTCLHYLYYILLFQAYRLGDLSQVYPISRGLAPALVALGAFLLIGEALTVGGLVGLATVCAGIGLLALQKGPAHANRKAIGMAFMLGLTIAAYSVSDGIGVRWSGSPTGYMGWLFLLEAPVALAVIGPRFAIRRALEWKTFGLGLVGGGPIGAGLWPRLICQDHRAYRKRLSCSRIQRHHSCPDWRRVPGREALDRPSGLGHCRGHRSCRACRFRLTSWEKDAPGMSG